METSVLQAIKQLGMDKAIVLTDNISEADAFLALHSKLKKNSQIQAVAQSRGIPIHVIKLSDANHKGNSCSYNEHVKGFKEFDVEDKMSLSETKDALGEARLAIEQAVIPNGEKVQLLPRPSHVISRQIKLIESYELKLENVGREPHFSLFPFPLDMDEKRCHISVCILPLPLDMDEKRSSY